MTFSSALPIKRAPARRCTMYILATLVCAGFAGEADARRVSEAGALVAEAASPGTRFPAPDSVLHGRILEAGSGRPVASATVLLADPLGNRRAGTFTRNDGSFRLPVGANPGDELRVERLGYATLVHVLDGDRVVPAAGIELRLDPRPIEFSAIEVTVGSRCGLAPADAGRTYELWEAARIALQAAELTESEALVRYRTRTWQHRETPDGTRAEAGIWSEHVTEGRPFETLSPAVLAEQGYVQTDRGERIVYGPDARVLLSDDFAGSHCLRVVVSAEGEEQPDGETWIGLAFEPSPERADVVRIGGTIWLDQESGELRRINFHFMWYHPRREVWTHWGAGSGGEIQYRSLDDGRWVIESWSLRVLSGGPGIWFDVAGGRLLQVLDGEARR
jgi:hypothetical protein